MRSLWTRLAAVAALGLALSACCSPGTMSALVVPLHPQETSMWCWAASGEMAMHYLGTDVKQCTQANDRFSRTDCSCNQCAGGPLVGASCAWGGWPDFGHYGFAFTRTSSLALTQAQLRSELSTNPHCGSRPVVFTWAWDGGGGHVMVLTGYQMVGDTMWLDVQDPWAPCAGNTRLITYEAYVSGPGYSHWDDFYGIRKTTP